MQIKMQNILNFSSFYNTVRSQKLSIKIAYKLAQLAKAIDTELQFYQEKLREIILEHGELDEHGNPIPTEDGMGIKVRPEAEKECFAAIYELQDIDVELPDIQFSIDDFDVNLSVDEIQVLLPFIKD